MYFDMSNLNILEQGESSVQNRRSLLLAAPVTKMIDIDPTKIATLKINHSRYIKKLCRPEEFTFAQI